MEAERGRARSRRRRRQQRQHQQRRGETGSGFCFLRVPSPGSLGTTKTLWRAPRGGISWPCALRPQRAAVPPPGASAAWGLRTASRLLFPFPRRVGSLVSGLWPRGGEARGRRGRSRRGSVPRSCRRGRPCCPRAVTRPPVLAPRRSLARATTLPAAAARAPYSASASATRTSRRRRRRSPRARRPRVLPGCAARSRSRSPPAATAAALAPAFLLRRASPPASWPIGGHQAAAVAGRIRGSRPPPPRRSAPFLLQPAGGRRREAWGARSTAPAGGGAAGNKRTCAAT
ncbi:uncharacterized protein LOC141574920 [Camelus bactrianus]|uniref:Uncharacterized protein LOC141574920 n=1 Tax=Camelus bactrianus TaxID=9837 RepID=A0AC58PEE4_CAMBA